MSVAVVTGILLIVVPVAFNAAFFELGRALSYPDILRREPDEILRRFAAGGSGLLLRWQLLRWSALALLIVVACTRRTVTTTPETTMTAEARVSCGGT